jgi:hypothetical protein
MAKTGSISQKKRTGHRGRKMKTSSRDVTGHRGRKDEDAFRLSDEMDVETGIVTQEGEGALSEAPVATERFNWSMMFGLNSRSMGPVVGPVRPN